MLHLTRKGKKKQVLFWGLEGIFRQNALNFSYFLYFTLFFDSQEISFANRVGLTNRVGKLRTFLARYSPAQMTERP